MHIHCVCVYACVFERESVYAYVVYMYRERESERAREGDRQRETRRETESAERRTWSRNLVSKET